MDGFIAWFDSVHPRGRGERLLWADVFQTQHGSSPRARGTRLIGAVRAMVNRFIPAGAGNANAPSITDQSTAVHPRGRGERTKRN